MAQTSADNGRDLSTFRTELCTRSCSRPPLRAGRHAWETTIPSFSKRDAPRVHLSEKASSTNRGKTSDLRHGPTRMLIEDLHLKMFNMKCQWDGSDLKARASREADHVRGCRDSMTTLAHQQREKRLSSESATQEQRTVEKLTMLYSVMGNMPDAPGALSIMATLLSARLTDERSNKKGRLWKAFSGTRRKSLKRWWS